MSDPFLPQRPVVTAYPKLPAAFAEAESIAAYLTENGLEAPYGSLYAENLRKRIKNKDFDLLIAVGGDGTMLRAGHSWASTLGAWVSSSRCSRTNGALCWNACSKEKAGLKIA
jgi:hypothetical protein